MSKQNTIHPFLLRWNELLDPIRFRKSKFKHEVDDIWNPFDSDYSRVAFSPAFRRLQDKTQMFPLDKSDFIRTRLTHSIEVSSVGRSIGSRIEHELINKGYLSETKWGYLPSILSVAGLTHDIGNPPFGHYGEMVIQSYFKKLFANLRQNYFHGNLPHTIFDDLTEQQKKDLCHFDGNVQSFRLLLKLSRADDEYSYNLTYPSLVTIMKYPKNSLTGNDASKGIAHKKFGYFATEEDKYLQINEALTLNHNRHPLTFILEACDDICYSTCDVEDEVAKGILSIQEIKESFAEKMENPLCKMLYENICKDEKREHMPDKLIAQNIRILGQQVMSQIVVKSFIANHKNIIYQKHNQELLEQTDAAEFRDVFKSFLEKCLRDDSILKRELLAKKVLITLLDYFIPAVLSPNHDNILSTHGKLYALISDTLKQPFLRSEKTTYDRLLLVTDFISGMTDYYALNLYHNLLGIEV